MPRWYWISKRKSVVLFVSTTMLSAFIFVGTYFLSLYFPHATAYAAVVQPDGGYRYSSAPNNGSVMTLIDKIESHTSKCRQAMNLIQMRGYSAEEHKVITDDGYILEIHRIIPQESFEQGKRKKGVVLMMHGIFGTSTQWVLIAHSPTSLAFALANAGYDVWLGNFRGNCYGRNHVSIQPSEASFWNFTFDEMGQYDVPATIDYVLDTTSAEQLLYIGHSMGTTAAFITLSNKPEYNKKLASLVALAPAMFVQHLRMPFAKFRSVADSILAQMEVTSPELFGEGTYFENLHENVCKKEEGCIRFLCSFTGCDPGMADKEALHLLLEVSPAPVSVKTARHFVQLSISGKFSRFDYGRAGNMQKYSRATPPEYAISNIRTPMHVFHSKDDLMVTVQDVLHMINVTNNTASVHRITREHFGHADFVLAKDMDIYVNNPILEIFEAVSSEDEGSSHFTIGRGLLRRHPFSFYALSVAMIVVFAFLAFYLVKLLVRFRRLKRQTKTITV